MPTVQRFARCRIEMYFGDHAPPHFHVITREEESVVVLIETLQIWRGEVPRREIAEAISWAAENQAQLMARWQEYSEEE
jgi:hypothetical protein